MKQSLFDKGLALGPPADKLAEGFLVRARGMHARSQSSFKTRDGSALLHALAAHSIACFADTYHYGATTIFYRETTSKKTGLSGNRLSFSRMGPTAGVTDWLYVAGGGALFKIDSSGNVQDWGITPPATDPDAAVGAAGALTGTYQYKFTYYNSTLGTRSNANTTAASVSPSSQRVDLGGVTAIPTSAQTGVDKVEIWRTTAGGSTFFKLTEINNGTSTYEDNDADTALSATELPTDNLVPYAYLDDCLGPHNASMFWITRTQSGQRGRVFYSPIGRAEGLKGFIEVCEDDAPLQRLFRFQGQLGVIGEAGIYLIGGGLPYVAREISGCPGTTSPHTVAVVPAYGVMYEASDGVRLFDGSTSALVLPGTVERIFNGESVGDLSSFTGVVADYCRNEYIISDTEQTLAFDASRKRWRDLGIGMDAIFYDKEGNVIAASIGSEVLDFEKNGETDDKGTGIELSFEPPHTTFEDERDRILQHITIEIDTGGQQVTATLLHEGNTTTLGVLNTSTRTYKTIAVGITGREFGLRLTGTLTAQVKIYSIDYTFDK